MRLKQILGHSTFAMVERYVNKACLERALIERRASPMDMVDVTRRQLRKGSAPKVKLVGRQASPARLRLVK